jgi:hypothetical protein
MDIQASFAILLQLKTNTAKVVKSEKEKVREKKHLR